LADHDKTRDVNLENNRSMAGKKKKLANPDKSQLKIGAGPQLVIRKKLKRNGKIFLRMS